VEGWIFPTQKFWHGIPYDRTTQNLVAMPLVQ